MKKYLAIIMLSIVTGTLIDARGGRGHGGRGHGSYHGRGGWKGRGYGRGWNGWGAATALPLGIAIGAAASSASQSAAPYYQSLATPMNVQDPYFAYINSFGSPVNKNAYREWLFSNYSQADAQYWWNYYLNNH